jgi:hypothetical protein
VCEEGLHRRTPLIGGKPSNWRPSIEGSSTRQAFALICTRPARTAFGHRSGPAKNLVYA